MSPKYILFLFVVIFFSSFNLARAEVIINEVQTFPTGERFLELYNTDNSEVDLTGWYMQRKTESGSGFDPLVPKPNFDGKTIGAHDYFVISRDSLSSSDIVLGTLTLTESNTIRIKKSEAEVVDKIGWGNASDCGNPCPSNPPEGKSIQKTEAGSWITAIPTPGKANQTSSSSDSNNSDSSNNDDGGNVSTTTTTPGPKPKVTEAPALKAKILANSLAFAGQPLEIKTNVFGYSNENIVLGRAYWNFGDGGSLEQINNFEKFYHTYYYPGEYVLFLEYYQNNFSKTPEATSKMVIKVISTTVTISKVGGVKDFFIELSNNASSDIDVSNWVISASGKTFILPKNSVIISKKSMTISGKITGFTYGDQYNLKLFSSTGELVFDYASSIAPIVPVKTPDKNTVQPKISASQDQINSETVKPLELVTDMNLGGPASVASSDVIKDNPIRTYILTTILTVFLGISAGAVYFVRRRKIVSNVGDDFKILD